MPGIRTSSSRSASLTRTVPFGSCGPVKPEAGTFERNPVSAFFGRITRNLAFDRYRSRSALKRGGAETALVLEELRDCVSGKEDPEQRLDEKELMADLNAFLRRLPPDKRRLFLRRYFYAEPISETAKLFGMKENQVAVTLHRLRKQLREYLLERGHEL